MAFFILTRFVLVKYVERPSQGTSSLASRLTTVSLDIYNIYIFVSWCVGGSKASDCVTNQLLPGLQMVCNTVMSLIKNSVCPLIDQRPKAVPGHTFYKK